MASASSEGSGTAGSVVLDATGSSESLGSSLDAALTCSEVVFAHAVNSQQALSTAERDSRINFLETDVVMGPLVSASSSTSTSKPMPVCSHELGSSSDLSVPEIITRAALAGKGLKLDIKDYHAIAPVLACLQVYLARAGREEDDPTARPLPYITVHNGPATLLVPAVIVNADVLTGTVPETAAGHHGLSAPPSSRDTAQALGCKFNRSKQVLDVAQQIKAAKAFLEMIVQSCPLSIISPGWTTAGEGSGVEAPSAPSRSHVSSSYTDAMVDEMLAVVQEYAEAGAHFTFPVRASYVRDSIGPLTRLLSAVPGSTLTVWSNVRLHPQQLAWIQSNLDTQRTMYDLPPEQTVGQIAAHSTTFKASTAGHLHRLLSPLGAALHALLPTPAASALSAEALTEALATGVTVTTGLLLVLTFAQHVRSRGVAKL